MPDGQRANSDFNSMVYLSFLCKERIWIKSESSCVMEKPVSCGRFSCGHANPIWVCSEAKIDCFYSSDMSAMSHVKPQSLFCFPQCCLVPTSSCIWFLRRQTVATRERLCYGRALTAGGPASDVCIAGQWAVCDKKFSYQNNASKGDFWIVEEATLDLSIQIIN